MNVQIFGNRMNISNEEKQKAVNVYNQLMEMAEGAIREGLLSLTGYLSKEELRSFYWQRTVNFICDGMDAERIDKIMTNYILLGNYTNYETFEAVMIVSGLLMIQKGENKRAIKEYLLSYLGEDLCNELNPIMTNEEIEKDIEKRVYACFGKERTVYEHFSNKICSLSDEQLKTLLRGMADEELICSVHGASIEAVIKIMKQLNICLQRFFVTEIEFRHPDKEQIVKAQKRILDMAEELFR